MRTYFITILILLLSFHTMAQTDYKKQWAKVDSLENLGQVKTALKIVADIFHQSKSDRLPDQRIKALLYRIRLEAQVQEEHYEQAIAFATEELKTAKSPEKQILYSILAQVYHQYFKANRWQILDRTPVEGDRTADFKTWDESRFLEVCTEYYALSLSDAGVLQKIPLAQFETILQGDKKTRILRPTLYDLLAFRAVEFFSNENSFGRLTAKAFKADQEELFAPAEQFIRLAFLSEDNSPREIQALQIFRDLLLFHSGSKEDAAALVDADLARLAYVHRLSVRSDRDDLYVKALRVLLREFEKQPLSAGIAFQLASRLAEEGSKYKPLISDLHKWDVKEALEIASGAAEKYPSTGGGKNCAALLSFIRQPALQTTGYYAVIPGQSSLALVEYKNAEKVYFRIVRTDPGSEDVDSYGDHEKILKNYLARKAIHQWNLRMPQDGDYQQHSAEIRIPELQPGAYVLLASVTPGFKYDSLITFTRFWSTSVSLITRNNPDGSMDVIVSDRKSGTPLPGARVQINYREYDYQKGKAVDKPGITMVADRDGLVRFNPIDDASRRQFYLMVKTAGDQFITESFYQGYRMESEPKTVTRTWFFTDRAIYRPGQTINYKGIVIDRKGNDSDLKTGYKTRVRFLDVNHQEVAVQEVVTNDFGSFTGSFTAPQGSLTGSMTLAEEHGQTNIRVEEYKRPKFETVFNPVAGSYKLGEEITVTGKATAYAGNPVSDAKVTFRVVRNARFPWHFWSWRPFPPSSPEMEITSGNTSTDIEGGFTIPFNAIPDPLVEEKVSPLFTYTVYADVTDINGETHSAETSVSVGYRSLLVDTDLPEEVNGESGIRFKLETTNLNGQPQEAQGTISIRKVVQPSNALLTRDWNRPDKFILTKEEFKKWFPDEVRSDEDDMTKWPLGEEVYKKDFRTPRDTLISAMAGPAPGLYRLEIKTRDSFGKEVEYTRYFTLFLPYAGKAVTTWPLVVTLLKSTAEPGETVPVIIASSLRDARIMVEISSLNGKPNRKAFFLDQGQTRLELMIDELHRGNLGIKVTLIRHNRVFHAEKLITVPYTNRELEITIGSFRSKLEPGQQEEWQITIKGKKGERAAAELASTLYDASLDAFVGHQWQLLLNNYLTGMPAWNPDRGFDRISGITLWYPKTSGVDAHRDYERMIDFGLWGGDRMFKSAIRIRGLANAPEPAMMQESLSFTFREEEAADEVFMMADSDSRQGGGIKEHKGQSMPPAKPRTDFNETAFFIPQLITNARGETVIRFKMPESLTRWRMLGLAHTRELKTGMIEKTLVTQKDLMVFPNAPRFLREGDRLAFAAKISNISEGALSGTAELHFFNAFTMQPVDERMKLRNPSVRISIPAGQSIAVSWDLTVPEGLEAVVYRITATAGAFSDGEEAPLPVLTNRMLVTESLPLPVRGNSSESFTLDRLVRSGQVSKTLQHYRLTLEYTSNPAWYAVQALPYLMEFPHECTEQVFSRYYANALAGHIANSDPQIKKVFEAWKNSSPVALKSNLEKNEELKSILLQETPWVRDAANESERKQRIGVLFDLTRMAGEQKTALKKLTDAQTVNGGWPWFPGMRESEYITQHIVSGLGHLVVLKVIDKNRNPDVFEMLGKAVAFLDREKLKSFTELKKRDPEYLKKNNLYYSDIHYFYARTCFLEEYPFGSEMNELVSYYTSQASQYWNKNNPYLKAMTALFLNRFGDQKTASLIMRSLTETALHSEEQGMYWRTENRGWFWHEAPVETQALIIEAYDEVLGDTRSVDELKVWLLKQKQTNDWKTTKATAEAVYALLLRGTELLKSDQQVHIRLGGKEVNPYAGKGSIPEAGTGYFKTSWEGTEITSGMGRVKVNNPNPGVAWGALYWQYFEQLDRITPAQTPLSLAKELFREVNTPRGPELEAITTEKPLKIGDKVVVRVILKSDRDMEYVHLKDMRASAFEPVNVLSGYHWQGGLGYYESTRDAATHFFIDFLQKGTYVFEYKLHATQKGEFSNGITNVQCMYAPEFAAHSEGIRVKVE